ncbi:hypothetical protein GW17_00017082 [Ensete ventricosum]|nr:hypothetical protein GW17_00017082 [Ensete ventricosum]
MSNPSFPLCTVAAAAAPTQATNALARWRPPLWLVPPLLAVGLAAGGRPVRAPYSRPPLRALHCKRLCPRVVLLPAGTTPAGCCAFGRLLPLAGAAGLPFGLALAIASRPQAGGLGRGLAVGGWPCMGAGRPSSSLPSLRKRSKNA